MGRTKAVLVFEEGSRDNSGEVLRDETTSIDTIRGMGTLSISSIVSRYAEMRFQIGRTFDVLLPMRVRELCFRLGFVLCRKGVVAKARVVFRNRGWNRQKIQRLPFIVITASRSGCSLVVEIS